MAFLFRTACIWHAKARIWSQPAPLVCLTGNHHSTSLSHSGIDPSRLGLSSHQAALLVRERATQVLLAREQQQLQARVAAAQRNAAAFAIGAVSGSDASSLLFAPTQTDITEKSIAAATSKVESSMSGSNVSGRKDIELDLGAESMDVDQPFTDRPTTAPAPSFTPGITEKNTLTSLINDGRPSSVPLPLSDVQLPSNLLSKLNHTNLSKAIESMKKGKVC